MYKIKTLIHLILLLITNQFHYVSAQNFAPVGAEWYFTERFAFESDIDFLHIRSTSDTTINGKNCRVLVKNKKLNCNKRYITEYVYESDSVVYFFDTTLKDFQILYNLKAEKGNSWINVHKSLTALDSLIIEVDSTDIIIINSVSLKRLHVTYRMIKFGMDISIYHSEIIERIGDMNYLFNLQYYWTVACDANYVTGLRCYSDSTFGSHVTGIAPSCNYTSQWVGVERNLDEPILSIYPTFAVNYIDVITEINRNLSLAIFDISGKRVLERTFVKELHLDISGLNQGLFIVHILESGQVIEVKKFIKNS